MVDDHLETILRILNSIKSVRDQKATKVMVYSQPNLIDSNTAEKRFLATPCVITFLDVKNRLDSILEII